MLGAIVPVVGRCSRGEPDRQAPHGPAASAVMDERGPRPLGATRRR